MSPLQTIGLKFNLSYDLSDLKSVWFVKNQLLLDSKSSFFPLMYSFAGRILMITKPQTGFYVVSSIEWIPIFPHILNCYHNLSLSYSCSDITKFTISCIKYGGDQCGLTEGKKVPYLSHKGSDGW